MIIIEVGDRVKITPKDKYNKKEYKKWTGKDVIDAFKEQKNDV